MAQPPSPTAILITIPVHQGQHPPADSLYYLQKLPNGHFSNEVYGYLLEEKKLLQIDIHSGFVRSWKEDEDGDLVVEGEKFICTPVRVM